MIHYDDFAKLDIRIGRILEAEKIPEGDELLKLIIDIGEDEPRQIMAGIASWYDPGTLIGKEIPVLCNLESRMLRGYESQGMIMAAGGEDKAILIHPEEEVSPGSKIS